MSKILVLDDEEEIVLILEKFLKREGFEVVTSFDGRHALDILAQDKNIDMMVLDMKMPKMKGIDVLKEAKLIRDNLPVIVLTGSIDVEKYVGQLSDLGYSLSDTLNKPVDLFTILEKVKEKLGQQG